MMTDHRNNKGSKRRFLKILGVVLFLLFIGLLTAFIVWKNHDIHDAREHSMEWWLKCWVNSSNIRITSLPLPAENPEFMGKTKADVLDAFQHFGKPGVEFLMAHASQHPDLNPIKWNIRRWVADITKSPKIGQVPPTISAAQNLFMELEKPFEWVEPHLMLDSQKSERVYFSIDLLCGITNRHDEMVRRLNPLLKSNHSGIRGKALKGLWRIREHALPAEEPLVGNMEGFIKFPQYVPVLESIAPNSEAATEILKKISMSEDWDQAFEASFAMLGSPYGLEYGFHRVMQLLDNNPNSQDSNQVGPILTPPISRYESDPPFLRRAKSPRTPFDRVLHKLEGGEVDIKPIFTELKALLDDVDQQNKVFIAGLMLTHGIRDEAIESLAYASLTSQPSKSPLIDPAKEAMRWLLIRDPEDQRVWTWYAKLVDSPKALHPEYHLNFLRAVTKPSKSAKRLLESISASNSSPIRDKGKKLFTEMTAKGLLVE